LRKCTQTEEATADSSKISHRFALFLSRIVDHPRNVHERIRPHPHTAWSYARRLCW